MKQLRDLAEFGIEQSKLPVGNNFLRAIIKSNPSTIATNIIKRRNPADIRTVRGIIGEQQFKELGAEFIENELMGLNRAELFSPARFVSKMQAYGDDVLNALYDKKTVAALKDMQRVAMTARGAEALAGNPSGTAQNLITFIQGGAVLRDPSGGLRMFLTPKIIAKLYLSPQATKYLAQGFKTPVGSEQAVNIAAKLSTIMANEERGADRAALRSGKPKYDANGRYIVRQR